MVQVLKIYHCTVSSPLQEKLNALESLYGQFGVYTLCDALDISRGTFYNHIFRNKKDKKLVVKCRKEIKSQIQTIYDSSEQIYGAGRITAILRNQGIKTSENYVSGIMKELRISSTSAMAKQNYKKWEKGKKYWDKKE